MAAFRITAPPSYYGVLFFAGGLLGWWLEKNRPAAFAGIHLPRGVGLDRGREA